MVKEFVQKLADKYDLKYHIYGENQFSNLPISVHLQFVKDDTYLESWGVSSDKDLAFFKALMELLERIVLNESCSLVYKRNWFSRSILFPELCREFILDPYVLYPDNSNGLSIHLSRRAAIEGAKLELIERHTILSALLLNISPIQLEDIYKFSKVIPSSSKLSFYYWVLDSYFIVVVMSKHIDGGYIFTHAASKDLRAAYRKAFEEIVPNLIFNDTVEHRAKPSSEIHKDDIMSFYRYWRFSGDDRLSYFLKKGDTSNPIPVPKIFYYSKCLIPDFINDFPFKLQSYRVISPYAQQLFFDNWDFKYINKNIFPNLKKLPDFPHFIS